MTKTPELLGTTVDTHPYPNGLVTTGYPRDKTQAGLGLEANQAAILKSGNLLLVFRTGCWQVDPKSGEITRVFALRRPGDFSFWRAIPRKDGKIYCTASGFMSDPSPISQATFGNWGELVAVDVRRRKIEPIVQLTDPIGIQFLSDTVLLLTDFNGWGGTGQIYKVHIDTGVAVKVVDGGLVSEPYQSHLDKDEVLWVPNAYGLEYDSEIIRIDPSGKQTIVRSKAGPYSGVICSLFPHPSATDQLLGVIVDWPLMATSSVFVFDKEDHTVTPIAALSAKAEKPGVFSPHLAIDGNAMWVAESYHNRLLCYDLKSNSIVKDIDISAITGPEIGIIDAWDFVECVAIIP